MTIFKRILLQGTISHLGARWRSANHIPRTELTGLKPVLFDILRFVSCCDLWTLSKHHRNLWLDKWSPKHFLPSDTHFLIVQGRFCVLTCLHSRESKPKSGLSTGFWLAQRQWHELCALTALEMKRSRTLCRDMMYYDELRTKKWLVTLSHGKTVSPKVQQFQRTCWYYSQWYCTQLMNRQHESEH